jgi:hypothetical protein
MGQSWTQTKLWPPSEHSGEGETSAKAVLEHLGMVLGSDAFAGAWRQRHLLRFLVEKHLCGQTGELQEYDVGVAVFEKGKDFDPRLNPIVRVETSRLRMRLRKYYERQGHANLLRIELPRGSYVPRIIGDDGRELIVSAGLDGPAPLPAAATVRGGQVRLWHHLTERFLSCIRRG